MNNLKCLIIDDEPVARKIIREYIEDVDFLDLAGEAENPAKAITFLKANHLDLIFLDIQMPGMNGIDFLKKTHPATMTIVTTAYPEYALEGFELDVLDYLVKPIGFDRFLKAVNKAHEYHALKLNFQENAVAQDAFFIKCGSTIEKIFFQEILFIKALANYVLINTIHRKLIAYNSLKGIEEKLPSELFVRVHKSHLVALFAISSIKNNQVVVGDTVIPISKHYKNAALAKIQPHLLKR